MTYDAVLMVMSENHVGTMTSEVRKSENTVAADFLSRQLLPFDFARQNIYCTSMDWSPYFFRFV